MADTLISSIDRDGETRQFKAHGHAVLADAGAVSILKGTFEPGWRWSADVAPIAGTASCQVRHLGLMLTGQMTILMDDGTEMHVGAGDLMDIAPGHDAWVVGNETCTMIDVAPEATKYATSRPTNIAAADTPQMTLVRRGYAAFNSGDVEALMTILAKDVIQHVPGTGPLSGTYKGMDAVLGYYGQVAEMTEGTFRAHLIDVHGDDQGHVTAVHQITATRNGAKRVSRGTILFTFLGDKASELLEMRSDLAGDEAFFA